MIVVAGHEQALPVARQLHLGPHHVDAGRQLVGVLVLCELFERLGRGNPRFRRLDFGQCIFGIQVEPGRLPNHQISRVLIIELGGLLFVLASLPVVIGLPVDQSLAGRNAEIEIRKWSDNGRNSRHGDPKDRQVAVLQVS